MAAFLPSLESRLGVILTKHNNTTITHILAANSKSPFQAMGIPVTMHELSPGVIPQAPHPSAVNDSSHVPNVSFGGQFGIIDFDTTIRLPRHVHISDDHFSTERILVLNGTALVELNQQIYIIPPRTMVMIAPGVPHTWTACPAGLNLSKALSLRYGTMPNSNMETQSDIPSAEFTISTGNFMMVYEYEEVTGFFPTEQVETLTCLEGYKRCEDLERIRFPSMSLDEVQKIGWIVWGRDVWKLRPSE